MPDGGNPNANSGKDDKAKRVDKKRKAFTRMFEGITDQYLSDYSERDVDLSGEEEADDKNRPVKEAPEPPPQPEAPKSTGLGSLMAAGQNTAAKAEGGNKISSLFETSDNMVKPEIPAELAPQPPQQPSQAVPAPVQDGKSEGGAKKKGLYTQLLSKPVLPEDIAAANPSAAPPSAAPPPPGASRGAPTTATAAPAAPMSPTPPGAPTNQPPAGYPSAGRAPGYPSPSSASILMPNVAQDPAPQPTQETPSHPPEAQAEPATRGSLPPAPKLGGAQRAPGPSPVPSSPPPSTPVVPVSSSSQTSSQPPSRSEPPQPQAAPGGEDAKWKAGFVEKFKDPPARPSKDDQKPPEEVPPPKDGRMHTAETAPQWGLETQKAVERLMLSEGEIPYQSAQDRRKKRAKRQEEDFEIQSASGRFAGEFTKVSKKSNKVKYLVIAANVLAAVATAIILYRCHEPGGSGFAIIGFIVWLAAAVAWLWALSLTFNGYKRILKRPSMFFLPLAAALSVVAMTDVPTQIAFQLCRSSLEVKADQLRAQGEHRPNLVESSPVGLVGLFHVIDYGVDHDGTVYFFTDDEPQPRGFVMSTQQPPAVPFGLQLSSHRIGDKWFAF